MQKKILVAVDGSIHSKQALRYAARLSALVDDITFELIHVQPPVSLYLKEAANQTALKAVMAKQLEQARWLLETCREELLRLKVAESRILLTTLPRQRGVAEDVLDFGQHGRHDAVLIGRRGASYLTELVIGSVTANLIEHSQVIPVWVVDGDVASGRILVAVDGSESSLRAVDHLSFVLAPGTGIHLQFVHVEQKAGDICGIDVNDPATSDAADIILNGDRRCVDRFYAQVRALLGQAGFSPKQYDFKILKSLLRTGKAVVDEAKKGDYGTVVIGRHGQGRTIFSGSVARYVINKAADRALWIVP